MFQALILAAALLGPQAGEPVSIPVQYDRPYTIETRIHRTRQTDDQTPRISDLHLRIDVQPTDEGFKTVWRDQDVDDRSDMMVETTDRLSPLRLTNLGEVWSERGLAALRFSSNDPELSDAIVQTLPENAQQALLFKEAILIAAGQGLELRVGDPLVQRLAGQRIGNSPSMEIISTMTLVSVDAKAGKAVATWVTELDPKGVAAALPATMRAALGLSEEEAARLEGFNEMLAQAVMKNGRNCRYDIDLASGIAEMVSCSEVLEVDFAGQKQKTETRMEATQRIIP